MSERAPRIQRIEEDMPASTILATTERQMGEAQEAGILTSASYAPIANITGAASPASRTLTIVNKGQDGNGAVVMATLALLGGVNPLDFDEMQFTLGSAANRAVAAGDVIACNSAPVGGTGLVDPGGRIQIELSRNA